MHPDAVNSSVISRVPYQPSVVPPHPKRCNERNCASNDIDFADSINFKLNFELNRSFSSVREKGLRWDQGIILAKYVVI